MKALERSNVDPKARSGKTLYTLMLKGSKDKKRIAFIKNYRQRQNKTYGPTFFILGGDPKPHDQYNETLLKDLLIMHGHNLQYPYTGFNFKN